MVKEFVPEMRSDKKDAEIARLREQVRIWKEFAIEFRNDGCVADKDSGLIERFDAALADTEEK